MLDHLVSPYEAIIAASMAVRLLTVNHLSVLSVVNSGDVSLKVSLSLEELALASTWFVEAVKLRTKQSCQRFRWLCND